jgi:hypothetical protein
VPGEDRPRLWAQRLPYVVTVLIVGSAIAIALSSSGTTPRIGRFMLFAVPAFFAVIMIRTARQTKRAQPVRDSVVADSVVAKIPRVWVQLNPGTSRSVLLKGGLFGVEVLVRTHSFEVGPPPLSGGASGTTSRRAIQTWRQAESDSQTSGYGIASCYPAVTEAKT